MQIVPKTKLQRLNGEISVTVSELSKGHYRFEAEVNGSPNIIEVILADEQVFAGDEQPVWWIYTTTWNNFANYGDEGNANKAYKLFAFAKEIQTSYAELTDESAKLIADIVHAGMDAISIHTSVEQLQDYRISHLILRKPGETPLVEYCLRLGQKTKGQRKLAFNQSRSPA